MKLVPDTMKRYREITTVTQMENNKITVGQVFSVVCKVLSLLLVALLLFVACTLAIDKFVNKSSIPSFFGKSVLVIATPSMSDSIEAGDMIVIDKADSYSVGDIITYFPIGETMSVTHRIVRTEGNKFYARGDANDSEDPDPIYKTQIVGKVVGRIPKLGIIVEWLRTGQGIAFLVAVAAVVVALIIVADSPDQQLSPLQTTKTTEITEMQNDNKD